MDSLKPPAISLQQPATSTQIRDYGYMVHKLMDEILQCGVSIGMNPQEAHDFAAEQLRERASKLGVLFPSVHAGFDVVDEPNFGPIFPPVDFDAMPNCTCEEASRALREQFEGQRKPLSEVEVEDD